MYSWIIKSNEEKLVVYLARKLLHLSFLLSMLILLEGCGSSISDDPLFISTTRQNPVYDLGLVEWDATNAVKLNPKLMNELDESVKYQSKASCGCITIKDDIEISPNASAIVPIELVLPGEPGPFKRSILFKCVSGNSPDLSLSLIGNVAPTQQLRTHLDIIDFGRFEKPVQRKLRLSRFDGSVVNFSQVSSLLNIQVVDKKFTRSGGKESMEITLEANPKKIPAGSFKSTMVVFTKHKTFSRTAIEIRGFSKHIAAEKED